MSFIKFENVFLRQCNGTTLSHDQACLEIDTKEPITFWSQDEECEGCMLLETARLPSTQSVIVNTYNPTRFAIRNDEGEVCNGKYHFGEFGRYSINLSEVSSERCSPRVTAEPNVAWEPLLAAVVIMLSTAAMWNVVKRICLRRGLYAKYFAKEEKELCSEKSVQMGDGNAPRPTRQRLRSLDTFRGLTIAIMIFIIAGGGGYAIFAHSKWNGLTVGDLVGPWFMFAMGESLVLSLNSRLKKSLPRITAFYQVARRSFVLTLIGIVLFSRNVEWAEVQFVGVLHRLAALYLVAGALECAFMRTSQNTTPGHFLVRDIAVGWQQWLITLILVGIQVIVTQTVAAPGCPRGYAGPGGLHLSEYNRTLQNCTGGIAAHIDRLIVGPTHILQYKILVLYKQVVPFSPYSLLSVLSMIMVVQTGAHATRIMLAYENDVDRIMRWVFWSIVFAVTGGALCGFSKNGGPIPICCRIGSLSYGLVTASTALLLKAVLYVVVDLKQWWGGQPFYYAGQNPLALYVGYITLMYNFPFHVVVYEATHAQLLALHSVPVLICLAVGAAHCGSKRHFEGLSI